MPEPAAAILQDYQAGRIDAAAAVRAYLDELEKAHASVAMESDRPFREALLAELVARGRLPPGTQLDPDE